MPKLRADEHQRRLDAYSADATVEEMAEAAGTTYWAYYGWMVAQRRQKLLPARKQKPSRKKQEYIDPGPPYHKTERELAIVNAFMRDLLWAGERVPMTIAKINKVMKTWHKGERKCR